MNRHSNITLFDAAAHRMAVVLLTLVVTFPLVTVPFASQLSAQQSTAPRPSVVPMQRMQPAQQMRILIRPQQQDGFRIYNTEDADNPFGTNEETTPSETERKTSMEERLGQLAELSFDRLPSTILKTWSTDELIADEKERERMADMPPAPIQSFLYNDERFKLAVAALQRDFTLGNWDGVEKFLKLLPKKNAAQVYTRLLASMAGTNVMELAANMEDPGDDPRTLQSQTFTPDDFFALGSIAPREFKKVEINFCGIIVRNLIEHGNDPKDLIARFENGLEAEEPVFTKREVAKLLMGAGRSEDVAAFLPDLETAASENDHEALNMLSHHFQNQYQDDKERATLELAWEAAQKVLAAVGVDDEQRTEALAMAVKMSSLVREELGLAWLNQTFVQRPESGREVISTIGAEVAASMSKNMRRHETRLERLKLQKNAVEALFTAMTTVDEVDDNAVDNAAENAEEGTAEEDTAEEDIAEEDIAANNKPEANILEDAAWQEALSLMAQNWLREARVSFTDDESSSIGPQVNRDMYGNYFYMDGYYNSQSRNRGYGIDPIPVGELLKIIPDEQWMNAVHHSLHPAFDEVLAQLYLKVGEESEALPFIEGLAEAHPKQAEKLVDEFLELWTKNHDPNSESKRNNYYSYMYGYESRAESIPLTRSKQQRNLEELQEIVPRLQKIVTEELDQDLILGAFFTCHSTAEVYREKDIEQVFGKIDNVKPEIIASLAQRMRRNLATTWRDAEEQKDKKTKRTKKEIQDEVFRGYEVAGTIIGDALARTPDDWALTVAQASLEHDENNYRAEMANSSKFTDLRMSALDKFLSAAEKYVVKLKSLEEKDYSTDAFDTWFYASLGACDPGMIEESHISAPNEYAKIRAVMDSIEDDDKREWHLSRFANLLFNRMSGIKPELKTRYLDAGFEIVGDHEQAADAREVHEYYRDLVTEIKLDAQVDGDANVGMKPFGLFVNLRHTTEIERESGGFGRYLQNQNNQGVYAYNYGRPTEDYRDKFEESARKLLGDHFEVFSVTFHKPSVKSVEDSEFGWRVTPYAYILLQAKTESVDKIPPLKISLDFLDTSGYAILPVESAALRISPDEDLATDRPYEQLEITEILDERQAEEGKLLLEIKATAQGLVPALDELMELDPEKFDVKEVDDPGVSIASFDDEADGNVILSERTWTVSYEAKSGLANRPKEFSFPKPKTDVNEVLYQRYDDADLVTVEPDIKLREKYAKTNWWLIAGLSAAGLFGLSLLVSLFVIFSRPQTNTRDRGIEIEENPSPFTAISLLENLRSNNGLSPQGKQDIGDTINRIERYYFGSEDDRRNSEAPDLHGELKRWLASRN